MQVASSNVRSSTSSSFAKRSAMTTLAPQLRSRAVAARSTSSGSKPPIDVSTVVGERIAKWLATPVDVLTFPARAGVGALLSVPEGIQSAQSDWQRLVELVQDPRPVEEKQGVLRKELEDTVLEFLEKGTNVEQDLLTNLKNILPVEAANALTELIPDPPNKVHQAGPVVPVDESDITPAHHYDDAYAASSPAAPRVDATIHDEPHNGA